tara:strand:+ start:239 stop:400 length:162 start_codon:yes stop_codon:yes gene_type:complete
MDEYKTWLTFDRQQFIHCSKDSKTELSSVIENVDEVTHFTGDEISKQKQEIET